MQKLEVWELAQKRGYLEGSSEYALFPDPYLWIIEQMKKRLPSYNGEHPVWLWVKKPDMRSTSHFKGGTKCVRLTIELDEKDVLLSDFDKWHLVIDGEFCSDNEQEDNDFENGKLNISKEGSWERIFDFNRDVDPDWTSNGEHLQGTTGRIYLDKIKKVEHFVSRKGLF
jgi:hypothetical protein